MVEASSLLDHHFQRPLTYPRLLTAHRAPATGALRSLYLAPLGSLAVAGLLSKAAWLGIASLL